MTKNDRIHDHDDTGGENPTEAFLRTLGSEPVQGRADVPRIPTGAAHEHADLPGIEPLGTLPAPGDTQAADQSAVGAAPVPGSDEEAYAALKARRAERRRRKLIHRGIAAGIIIVLVAGGFAVNAALSQQPTDIRAGVVTDMATRGTFVDQVSAKGTLEPLSSTVVAPAIDGQIESVNVVAGQTVAAGDVLMTIKNDELGAAVDEAARNLKQAKANLASARSQAAAASQLAEAAPDGAASGSDSGAKDAVAAAQAAVESAQAALDQANAKAALRTVTAPAAGSIVAMNAQVGANLAEQSAAGANSGPLMQIADLSKMKVTVQVSEEDIAKIAADQAATVRFPAFPDLELAGKVTSIASIATTGTGGAAMSYDGSGSSPTFAVGILIDAPDPRLKPGMTAEVTLITKQLDDVIMVPATALQSDDGTSYYVNVQTDAESGNVERRDVTVVAQNDDMAVIGRPADAAADSNPDMAASPLEDGETVVIAGGMGSSGAGDAMAASGGGMAVM